MSAPHMFTLDALTLDGVQIECSLAVVCSCREDPDLPWKGVLCGSTLHGSQWIDRPLHMSGHAEEGASAAVVAQAEAAMRAAHDLGPEDEDDFTVTSQEDLLSMVEEVTGILTLFLGVIAVISLVVGGNGIMNIMLVSVTERTREIGIRKAVGARRGDILGQFLLEAMVLSVIGGALGIGLGALVSWAVGLSGVLSTSVSGGAVLLALGFSLAVGLLSGVYPAHRASRLQPIDALRYE